MARPEFEFEPQTNEQLAGDLLQGGLGLDRDPTDQILAGIGYALLALNETLKPTVEVIVDDPEPPPHNPDILRS
jgi:hypothetical protein